MKVSELIKQLEPYKDFDISARVNRQLSNEEQQNNAYGYPIDFYDAKLSIGDIAYSDKKVIIDIEVSQ